MSRTSTQIPLYKLFPSILTILNLCLGVTAIRYSLDSKFRVAVGLIVISCFMDGLDGKMARMLKATSEFGAHLDSLADLVSFGVAPAVVMYMWSLHGIAYRGVGWMVVLIYLCCGALRLARFNAMEFGSATAKHKALSKQFFVGVPITLAAFLCVTPIMISFELYRNLNRAIRPAYIAMYVVSIAALMISRIPTLSTKRMRISQNYVPWLLCAATICVALIILDPWLILPVFAVLYLISMPIVSIYHKRSLTEKNDITS